MPPNDRPLFSMYYYVRGSPVPIWILNHTKSLSVLLGLAASLVVLELTAKGLVHSTLPTMRGWGGRAQWMLQLTVDLRFFPYIVLSI